MGKSDQASRPRTLLWLAGFPVVFGVVSWFVSWGIDCYMSKPTPGPTQLCKADQLELSGAFNECASVDRTSAGNCAVTPRTIRAVFTLLGSKHDFLLNLEIPVRYREPGDYNLTTGGSEVDIVEYTAGAIWRSVAGVITTTSADGRSGIVRANLTYDAGGSTRHLIFLSAFRALGDARQPWDSGLSGVVVPCLRLGHWSVLDPRRRTTIMCGTTPPRRSRDVST
jgi:hypothetical protein